MSIIVKVLFINVTSAFESMKCAQLTEFWCKIVENRYNIIGLVSSCKNYRDSVTKIGKNTVYTNNIDCEITNIFNMSGLLKSSIT